MSNFGWRPSVAAWLALDAAATFAAMWLAFAGSPSFSPLAHHRPSVHIGQLEACLLYATLSTVLAHVMGLHNPLLPRERWLMLTRCAGAAWLALAVLAGLVFAVLYHRIGRLILLQAAVYAPLLMAMLRILVWMGSERRRRLLLLGAERGGQLVKDLIQRSGVPLEVVAFVDHKPELWGSNIGNCAVLEPTKSLMEYCLELHIDEVVTCVGGKLSDEAMNQLMDCLSLRVRVSEVSNFVERNFFQVPVEMIRGEWFLHADLELAHPIFLAFKRALDVVAALAGLLVSGPLMLLASLAIRLESPGPVFYSQVRAGLHNRPFRIWKLRSMRVDAEKEGPRWADGADPRITVVGRMLRRSRLDEVPQFWNILRGDMSLVGPRPERPEFVEQLGKEIPFYNQRHLVKPGLTGWAQINYPYGASSEDALHKLKYDLYYVKNASLALDLQIALRTFGAMMKGAR